MAPNQGLPLRHPGPSEEFSDRTHLEGPLTGPARFGRGETGSGAGLSDASSCGAQSYQSNYYI